MKVNKCISHRKEHNWSPCPLWMLSGPCQHQQPLPALGYKPQPKSCPGTPGSLVGLPRWASSLWCSHLQPFSCSISCCLWRNLSLVDSLVRGPCCHPLALLMCCEAVPRLVEASSMLQSLLAHPPLEESPVIAIPWQTQQVHGNCNKINFSKPLGKLPKCNLFSKSLLPLVSMYLEGACKRK